MTKKDGTRRKRAPLTVTGIGGDYDQTAALPSPGPAPRRDQFQTPAEAITQTGDPGEDFLTEWKKSGGVVQVGTGGLTGRLKE